MGQLVQHILVFLIVLAAVLFVLRALLALIRGRDDEVPAACAGCQLKDQCTKQKKKSAKKCADNVAHVKKRQ